MTINIRVLVGMVLVGIVLVGCGVQDKVNLEEEVYRGSEAMRMNFVSNVPEPTTYTSSGEIMDIALELENVGTFPLKGDLYFSGHDPNIIRIPTQRMSFPTYGCTFPDILPRSKSNPYGGTCVADFRPVVDLTTITDSYETNLQATALFWYGTNAQVDFCVDTIPNRFRTSPQACVMQPVSLAGGQGAPVAVTHVEGNAIGRGQILYRITIQNIGPGLVVGNPTQLPSRLRPTDLGRVSYRIGIPGAGQFGASFVGSSQGRVNVGSQQYYDNSGNLQDLYSGNVFFNDPELGVYFNQFFNSNDAVYTNTVRLVNDRAIITQVVDYGTAENAFRTPLQIVLGYGYLQYATVPIRLVNVDAYRAADVGGRIVVDTDFGRIQTDSRGVTYQNSQGGGIDIR